MENLESGNPSTSLSILKGMESETLTPPDTVKHHLGSVSTEKEGNASKKERRKTFVSLALPVILTAMSMVFSGASIIHLLGVGPLGILIAFGAEAGWGTSVVAAYQERALWVRNGEPKYWTTAAVGWGFLVILMGVLAWHGVVLWQEASSGGTSFLGFDPTETQAAALAVCGPLLPLAAKIAWTYELSNRQAPNGLTKEQRAHLEKMSRSRNFRQAVKEEMYEAVISEKELNHSIEMRNKELEEEKNREEHAATLSAKRRALEEAEANNKISLETLRQKARLDLENRRIKHEEKIDIMNLNFDLDEKTQENNNRLWSRALQLEGSQARRQLIQGQVVPPGDPDRPTPPEGGGRRRRTGPPRDPVPANTSSDSGTPDAVTPLTPQRRNESSNFKRDLAYKFWTAREEARREGYTLTQSEFAQQMGTSAPTLSRALNQFPYREFSRDMRSTG